MPADILLITGTDTEVGKTFVGAALCRALQQAGRSVLAIKPVESGTDLGGPEDGQLLAEATGQAAPSAALVRLGPPIAPPVAADEEGVVLDSEAWLRFIREASEHHELVVVEGAGGLLSPLTWQSTALDLAVALDATVLVVAHDRLGAMNQSRLVIHCLRQAGCKLAGLILNGAPGSDEVTGSNSAALRRLEPETPVLSLPPMEHWHEAVPLLSPVMNWLKR